MVLFACRDGALSLLGGGRCAWGLYCLQEQMLGLTQGTSVAGSVSMSLANAIAAAGASSLSASVWQSAPQHGAGSPAAAALASSGGIGAAAAAMAAAVAGVGLQLGAVSAAGRDGTSAGLALSPTLRRGEEGRNGDNRGADRRSGRGAAVVGALPATLPFASLPINPRALLEV